jgi:hypothetical protein
LSSIGAIWLVCDLYGTNFYKFYGRFKEIGLLLVGHDFQWLKEFGLDGLLGINVNFNLFFIFFIIP